MRLFTRCPILARSHSKKGSVNEEGAIVKVRQQRVLEGLAHIESEIRNVPHILGELVETLEVGPNIPIVIAGKRHKIG